MSAGSWPASFGIGTSAKFCTVAGWDSTAADCLTQASRTLHIKISEFDFQSENPKIDRFTYLETLQSSSSY